MSEVLVGTAYSTMELRYQQFTQGASVVEQTIQRLLTLSKTPITVQAQIAGAGSGSGAGAGAAARSSGAAPGVDADAAAYDRLQRAQAALEAQQARLARTQGDSARAAALETQAQERLTSVLNAQEGVTVQSIAVERQLTSVELQSERAAQAEAAAQRQAGAASKESATYAQQFGDGLKSGLLGIVGPAAIAAASIAAIKGTVDSFRNSLDFKSELDQTTASITAQLAGVRDSSKTFDEARAFADQYKLTQVDTATAIQASVPLLRQSKASLTDVLTVLSQLQVLKPEQGIQGAAFALAELEGGQSRSLATRFNIPIAKATEMKNEIQKGGDAVTVLGKYLDDAGVSAEALAVRTQGVAGALNDVKIAQEQLTIAQGNLAASKGGLLFIDEQTRLYRGLANVLNGELLSGLKATGIEYVAQQKASEAYNNAITAGKTEAEAAAAAQDIYNRVQQIGREQQGLTTPLIEENTKVRQQNTDAIHQSAFALSEEANTKLDSAVASGKLADEQSRLDADSQRAALGLLGAGDQALLLANKYNIAATTAQYLINQQQKIVNPQALADQRAGERSGGTVRSQSELDAQTAARNLAADHERQLQNARDQAALQSAKTAGQKIAILQRELARSTDDIERVNIQAQIDAAKVGGKTKVSAAQTTALQLQNVEENSGLQLLKTQRENNERLADQQQDFELGRTRKQEDYDEKRRSLLAHGQRAQAAALAQDFAKEQRRAAEDFNIARARTLRNNAEGTGDIDTRTDLRQSQIGQRAALRGVRPAGGAPIDLGSAPPTLTGAPGRAGAGGITLVVQVQQLPIQLDGKTIATASWAELQKLIDDDLAETLRAVVVPSPSRAAVAGSPP